MDSPGSTTPPDSSPADYKPKQLPSDLPTSLNDRRLAVWDPGVEVYDPWQGQAQYLTTPKFANPLSFNLALDDDDGDMSAGPLGSNGGAADHDDSRLGQMLAAQAAHQEDAASHGDVKNIARNEELSHSAKSALLQQALTTAASNGDLASLKELLKVKQTIDIDLNAPDEEGTAPMIYASCFGHEDIVTELLKAGAEVDRRDKHQWTSLMWATTNRHRTIVKILLDHGAAADAKSSSGRTAFDFVEPHSDMSDYLQENGWETKLGGSGFGDDFYKPGFTDDRLEEEMAEAEMRRRMMMESALNLEVDLGNLGLDEQPEMPEPEDETQEFVWDKCLHDQMFVFQENELPRILDIIITNMQPQRTPSQKPVPANILFLSARYAHYHANPELLETLLVTAMDKINDVVERHQWDMTILAFWISNATLLLHYLKKDTGLLHATTEFQAQLAELINEIFILIIRDAERRMDKVLDPSMLDHETIPGFEDVHFQNEWKIFRYKPKAKAEDEAPDKRFRPPSPKKRAKPSPRNITSLLSSTLFVLDLYDIHSVITTQIMAQLLYWLGAELFNRIINDRKYLARTKAMQVRMNISVLEEWARSNNRYPEHYENGSTTTTGDGIAEAARQHLTPVIQLLQWLQVLSSLGEQGEALSSTIPQLARLSPQQLIHAVKYYRPEVGEKTVAKPAMRKLYELEKEMKERKKNRKSFVPSHRSKPSNGNGAELFVDRQPDYPAGFGEEDAPEHLLFDPALMLPFSLPTSTDMLISYGAGLGGMNRDRERKYIPTVPPEFLSKLDTGGQKSSTSIYGNNTFND